MYHELRDPPAGAAFPELYVRPSAFRAQMAWLDRHGYEAVTLQAVWDHWHRGRALPPHAIVVSIDDGFRSTATVGLPVLRTHGWPGVLNLAWHHFGVRWGLREGQIRNLVTAGWEIDAHSLTHADLTAVSDEQLRAEVVGSRRVMLERLHVRVDFFCYPAGRFDARVIEAVRRAGYLGATTTLDGLASPDEPFALRRVRVSRTDSLEEFAARLEGLRGP
jgi:peptidoglycan/xylan/chitin deacetylase (PgdA/CDA1 family)